jgi:hypothetical protein
MRDKHYGITYPIPEWLQVDWFWKWWKEKACKYGFHLLDEVLSVEEHYLYCDACELVVPLESVPSESVGGPVKKNSFYLVGERQ